MTMSPGPWTVASWGVNAEYRSAHFISPHWSCPGSSLCITRVCLLPPPMRALRGRERGGCVSTHCLLFKLLSRRTRLSIVPLVGYLGLIKSHHLTSPSEQRAQSDFCHLPLSFNLVQNHDLSVSFRFSGSQLLEPISLNNERIEHVCGHAHLCAYKYVKNWEGSVEAGSQKLRTQQLKREKKGSEMAESPSDGRLARPWPRAASTDVT